MINLKSLLTKIVSNMVLKTGTQMIGTLRTSFKQSTIIGSMLGPQGTIDNLLTQLSGKYQMGSVYITAAYTSGGITVPSGWYNYISFNNVILLLGMTVDKRMYTITSTYVAEIQYTNFPTKGNMTNGTTTYYNLNGIQGTHYYYVKQGNKVTVNFNVKCNQARSSMTQFASGLPTHNHPTEISFPLACETAGTYRPMWVRINTNGTISGSLGTAGKYYYGSISYITNDG